MKDTIDTCQGTLVVHVIGNAECTEPDCVDLGLVRHYLVLDCADVTGGCRCLLAEVARAS